MLENCSEINMLNIQPCSSLGGVYKGQNNFTAGFYCGKHLPVPMLRPLRVKYVEKLYSHYSGLSSFTGAFKYSSCFVTI